MMFGGQTSEADSIKIIHKALDLDAGIVACRLGAVGTVFGAASGLDRKQGAKLHVILRPIRLVHGTGLLEQFEEGQGMKALEFGEKHEVRNELITKH